MINVFISQCMKDRTEEEILEERRQIIEKVMMTIDTNTQVDFLDSYFEDFPNSDIKNKPAWYLGKSIQVLSQADLIVFGPNYEKCRGCLAEEYVAKAYEIPIMLLNW